MLFIGALLRRGLGSLRRPRHAGLRNPKKTARADGPRTPLLPTQVALPLTGGPKRGGHPRNLWSKMTAAPSQGRRLRGAQALNAVMRARTRSRALCHQLVHEAAHRAHPADRRYRSRPRRLGLEAHRPRRRQRAGLLVSAPPSCRPVGSPGGSTSPWLLLSTRRERRMWAKNPGNGNQISWSHCRLLRPNKANAAGPFGSNSIGDEMG